jgi:nucleoid-associated protein YgaU
MGISTFVREAGERIVANAKAAFQLNPGHDASDTAPASANKSPTKEKSAGDALEDYIHALKLDIDELKVSFDAPTSTVHVSGVAADQATKEKVILCCGNVAGVEKVDENITVRQSSEPAKYHTVAKGDTLSAIAKKMYGDANKYQAIFEANKPMLKDPDKIYPGQSLRIPPLN